MREAAQRHARVMLLYDDFADLPSPEREAKLAALEADEPDIAQELRELLAYETITSPMAQTGEGLAALSSILAGEQPPATDGRFDVMRVLGEGGMGTVYLAQQIQPKRMVALKVLKGELASERVRRRFAAEGDILARLSHPGIARVFEAVDGVRPYLVMELVDGTPLTTWAERKKPDLRAKVELLVAIAEAVDHAHRSGVVHRDLKPANILVTEDGTPKILDFGIARVMEDTASGGPAARGLTQAGELIGTPAYMSPEQASLDPRRVDHRTDVYALGVVAYELLTGRMPYPISDDVMVNLTRIRVVQPTPAGRIDKALRGDLEVILGKALEKTNETRYQSAAALAFDLTRWLRSETILARPPSVLYQIGRFAKRNRALVIASAVVFLVLVIGAVSTTALWLESRRTSAELARRVDELVLLQARGLLPSDPTAAVTMLDSLSPEADWARAFTVAWDADARTVSESTLTGHESDVEWVDVASDGAIVSASFDGTVRVWRGRDPALVLRGHEGGVNRALASPRAGLVASAGRDGTLRLWSARDGSNARVVHRQAGECEDIVWSPDGRRVAGVGGGGAVVVVDALSGKAKEVAQLDAPLNDVAWSGDSIVAAGKEGRLAVISASTNEVTLLEGHKAEVDSIDVLGDGPVPAIASAAIDGELRVWDPDGDVRSFPSPEGSPLKGVVFVSPQRVAVVDRGGTLRIWDLPSGRAVTLATGGSVYRDVAVSPDGAWLATASDDRKAVLWDLATFEPILLRGHRDAVLHLDFTNDRRLVTSGQDGDVRVWRLATTRARWPLASMPRALALHGRQLVLAEENGRVSRADLGTGKLEGVADGVDGNDVVWSQDGSKFLTTIRRGVLQVRSQRGALMREIAVGGRAVALAFAPDGGFAAATNDGVLVVSDGSNELTFPIPGGRANALVHGGGGYLLGMRDGRLVRFADGTFTDLATLPGEITRVAIDGDRVAAAGGDRALCWQLGPTLTHVAELVHDGPVTTLALTGDTLASGGRDGVVKVATRGHRERALRGHRGPITALALAPHALVSGSRDRTIRIWDLSTFTRPDGDDGDEVPPPRVIDLFDGPIRSLELVSLGDVGNPAAAGGDVGAPDHVVALADEPVLTVWPLAIPNDEATVRAWLGRLVYASASTSGTALSSSPE